MSRRKKARNKKSTAAKQSISAGSAEGRTRRYRKLAKRASVGNPTIVSYNHECHGQATVGSGATLPSVLREPKSSTASPPQTDHRPANRSQLPTVPIPEIKEEQAKEFATAASPFQERSTQASKPLSMETNVLQLNLHKHGIVNPIEMISVDTASATPPPSSSSQPVQVAQVDICEPRPNYASRRLAWVLEETNLDANNTPPTMSPFRSTHKSFDVPNVDPDGATPSCVESYPAGLPATIISSPSVAIEPHLAPPQPEPSTTKEVSPAESEKSDTCEPKSKKPRPRERTSNVRMTQFEMEIEELGEEIKDLKSRLATNMLNLNELVAEETRRYWQRVEAEQGKYVIIRCIRDNDLPFPTASVSGMYRTLAVANSTALAATKKLLSSRFGTVTMSDRHCLEYWDEGCVVYTSTNPPGSWNVYVRSIQQVMGQ